MAKGLFFKLNVPAGSTLRAKVSPAAPPPAPDLWSADLFLRRDDGALEVHHDDAALRAGAAHVLTGSSKHFVGQLVITFAGASDALVEISVERPKPKGKPHGKPYKEVHSAAPADAIALIFRMA